MEWRQVEEKIFKVLMMASTFVIFLSLVLILTVVVIKGFPSLSLAMIFQRPRGGYYLGKEGGIANAIVGSLYVAGGATLISILLSIPVALYMNIYTRPKSRFVTLVRFSFDVLCGVPSIVFGAFGFAIMLYFRMPASLLMGILTVALLILPIMLRAMDEVLRMVPRELLETSAALGANRLETGLKVAVRQALPGLLTAVLIAFGRGIGDAASVLFTAGFTDYIPDSLMRPAATLPLAIFFQLGSPMPEVQGRAYASALILTLIILVISVTARLISKKLTVHVIK